MELPRRLRFDGSDGGFPPALRPVVNMGHWRGPRDWRVRARRRRDEKYEKMSKLKTWRKRG
jgi:hypothetical protein